MQVFSIKRVAEKASSPPQDERETNADVALIERIKAEAIVKIADPGLQASLLVQAAKLESTVRGQLEAIRTRAAPLKKTRMMFVVGRTPNRLDGLIVVGQASYLNEIIALAGGENVFRDAVASYPGVSLEEVLARNPDVIVDMGDMADTVGVTDAHKREVTSLWDRLSSVAAVKQHRVYAVASDVYVEPGPRVVDAAKAFLEMLHPEAR